MWPYLLGVFSGMEPTQNVSNLSDSGAGLPACETLPDVLENWPDGVNTGERRERQHMRNFARPRSTNDLLLAHPDHFDRFAITLFRRLQGRHTAGEEMVA